eukprot:5059251-Pleurochrysis_carterae.AAC.2
MLESRTLRGTLREYVLNRTCGKQSVAADLQGSSIPGQTVLHDQQSCHLANRARSSGPLPSAFRCHRRLVAVLCGRVRVRRRARPRRRPPPRRSACLCTARPRTP